MPTPNIRPPLAKATLLAIGPVTLLAAIASTTPLAVGASGLCLALIVALLWRSDDPPILLLPALFQWSEVAIVPLSTIWRRIPLNDLAQYNIDLEPAVFFGLAGIIAIVVGMWLGSGGTARSAFAQRLRADVDAWPFREVARVCFFLMLFGYASAVASGFGGPQRELLSQLSNVKYIGLFALAYWCLARQSHFAVLGTVMAFELIFGMTGFFAQFKYSVLTLVVAALAARPKLRVADLTIVSVAAGVLFTAAIFWSAVKADYREFVNRGTGAQVVLAPMDERLNYLATQARSMNARRFGDGFDLLIARHGYVEFLAITMARVPNMRPHEDGRLTMAMLQHISTPRILFPDKPPLPSDTEVTARYTGLSFSNVDNTSISIGYLGELYVDFGIIGALFAAGIVGGLVGLVYRVLRDYRGVPALLVAGLCLIAALPAGYFGTAYAKLMGGFVSTALIAAAIQRYALPFILPLLRGRTAARPARPPTPSVRR